MNWVYVTAVFLSAVIIGLYLSVWGVLLYGAVKIIKWAWGV